MISEIEHTELLVIGAGPYGLATAAHARRQGIETLVLGEPMSFWRENMPAKMMLRSGPDWHMDVAQKLTMMTFLEERGIEPEEVDPIPISLFPEYADWFRERAWRWNRTWWRTSSSPTAVSKRPSGAGGAW
jgi:FAD-dependent urate hydroxylase